MCRTIINVIVNVMLRWYGDGGGVAILQRVVHAVHAVYTVHTVHTVHAVHTVHTVHTHAHAR